MALKHHPDRHSNASPRRPPSPSGGGEHGGEDKDGAEAEGSTHSAFQDVLTAYETLCTAKELLSNEASAYQVSTLLYSLLTSNGAFYLVLCFLLTRG